MKLEDFPLAWRWAKPSCSHFSESLLKGLKPLDVNEAQKLAASIPVNFPLDATRHDASVDAKLTRRWLKELNVESNWVTISWDRETALTLRWTKFCDYWDDFCYPSSDDADLFLENGLHFMRWNHFEVFEVDLSAI